MVKTPALLLDVEHPLADLLAGLGLTQAGLAALDGKRPHTVSGAVARGGGIGLDVLVRFIRATGRDAVIKITPPRRGRKQPAIRNTRARRGRKP
jgi:hypothetical protein